MKSVSKFVSDNLLTIIVSLALTLSVSAVLYFFNTGYITAYGDSRAHLNISRRVFDNITPGIAQLGGVWLPLLHMLMMPFINNNFLWHSGLAGTLVSVPMYILAVIFVYKLVLEITNNKFSALLSSLVIMLNINMLYLQTTPMTEALFVATLTGSVYFLTRWSHRFRISDLIISSIFFLLSTVNRYEGWSVVFAGSAVVGIVSLRFFGVKKVEGKLIMFSTLAMLGILLWLLWQAVIFGNPLYFLNSEFSAKAQTLIAIRLGEVPQYHNIKISTASYVYALLEVIGMSIVVTSLLGLLIYVVNFFINIRSKDSFRNIPILILLVPGIFLIYALYNGNIPLSLPQIIVNGKAGTYFNIRYALYSLPAVAVFFGLISKRKIVQTLLLGVLLFGSFMLIKPGIANIATINDTKNNIFLGSEDMLLWISKNIQNETILVSAATSDPIIFGTGKNIKSFITEGSGKYWVESMETPGKYASWIIIAEDDRDMVKKHLTVKKIEDEFIKASEFGVFTIYKKK